MLCILLLISLPIYKSTCIEINLYQFQMKGDQLLYDKYINLFNNDLLQQIGIILNIQKSYLVNYLILSGEYVGIIFIFNRLSIYIPYKKMKKVEWRSIQLYLTLYVSNFLFNLLFNVLFPTISPAIYVSNYFFTLSTLFNSSISSIMLLTTFFMIKNGDVKPQKKKKKRKGGLALKYLF